MDPRQLFTDDRILGACVYCGGPRDTRDHVPSRVLLDEPFPDNLPVVDCCETCNTAFSLDEQYLACFVDCVIAGSTVPSDVARAKVSRILAETPALASRIAASEMKGSTDQQIWEPEIDRIHNVLLKLARGHVAYELGLPQIDEPLCITCAPIIAMADEDLERFVNPQETSLWPEIGSRAFIRACKQSPALAADHWEVVQGARYQYLVSQADGSFVRILLSDYLACEVRWNIRRTATK
ncbi:MAG: hypothetical protein ACYTEL_27105 [Planctomycetota bacterium]|jgi:hypothetical protein